MSKLLSLLAVSTLVVLSVRSEHNIYTVTVNGGTLDSPVEIAETQVEVYDAATGETATKEMGAVSFAANSIFRKRGVGYMRSSALMEGFTGEIRIEEGAYIITSTNQMGTSRPAEVAPLVVVSNNASLVFATTAATCPASQFKLYNNIIIEGVGCGNGIGAICNKTTVKHGGLYGLITLSGDARIHCYNATAATAINGLLDLAGHVLTIKKTGNNANDIIYIGNDAGIINSVSDIPPKVIMDASWFRFSSYMRAWDTNPLGEVVMTNGGRFHAQWTYPEKCPWKLRVAGINGNYFNFKLTGSETSLGKLSGGNSWLGPVQIDGKGATFYAWGTETKTYGFALKGPVSGEGNIRSQNAVFQLAYPTNTFTGSFLAHTTGAGRSYLGIWHSQSMSPASSSLTVSDTTVKLITEQERYDLPPIYASVKDGASMPFSGGAGGFAPFLRKSGGGTLDLGVPLTVTGRVDIAAGTLKLSRYAASGLVAGRQFAPNTQNFTTPDGNSWTRLPDATYGMTCDITNRVELSPSALYTTNSPLGFIAKEVGAGSGVIVMYNGYIWNRSGDTKQWTFAGGLGTNMGLWLDEVEILRYGQWKTGVKNTVDVSPGAHKLRIVSYGLGNAAKDTWLLPSGAAFTNLSWKGASNFGAGIMYDPDGRNSTKYTDYKKLEDPGDGSLLTVSADGSVTTESDCPSFWELDVSDGAVLDLFGNHVVVGDLSGAGTVSDGHRYFEGSVTVTNSFAAAKALLLAGKHLTVDAPLKFKTGAKVTVDDLSSLPRLSAETFTLCIADEAIEGAPMAVADEFDELASRWTVIKRADGKALSLQYRCGTKVILR